MHVPILFLKVCMTDFRPDPRQLLNSNTAADFAEMDRKKLEAAVVEYMLSKFDIGSFKKEIREASNCDGWLTFSGFYSVFPGFPIYLFVRKFPKVVARITVKDLFDGGSNMCFLKEHESLSDEVPEEHVNSYGVAFFWPHLLKNKTSQGGVLVFHNYETNTDTARGRAIDFYRYSGERGARLEPLSRLVEVILAKSNDWLNLHWR